MTFIDEHPDSIDDPFIFPPRVTQWIDVPGSLHQGAGSAAFLDGRAELHMWTATARMPAVSYSFRVQTPRPGDPDIAWFMANSARR